MWPLRLSQQKAHFLLAAFSKKSNLPYWCAVHATGCLSLPVSTGGSASPAHRSISLWLKPAHAGV
jgi:hypothetical protein